MLISKRVYGSLAFSPIVQLMTHIYGLGLAEH